MLKEYRFNQPYRKIKNKSVYAQEHRVIKEFMEGNEKNIQFEYDSVNSAVNAAVAIRKHIAEYKRPLLVMQREIYVFVARKGEEENKGV